MRINETAILYKNIFEEGTAKGSFLITDNGIMTPRTRNETLWGLTSSLSIPEKYRNNPNIITSLKEDLAKSPLTALSAFFKFQKNPFAVYAERVGMEIASYFNTKTCYNYPANLDNSSNSLYRSVSPYLNNQTQYGNLVFSFLGKDDELHTFFKIANSQEISVDAMTMIELIPNFIRSQLPQLSSAEVTQMALISQRDFAYQYLLRDFIGDVDYTSKNSGLVFNQPQQLVTIAPNFDYGEVMNNLIANKFTPPELFLIEDVPEETRRFFTPAVVKSINDAKLKKYNATTEEIARIPTFDKSANNIQFICSTFPDVAQNFLTDLRTFTSRGLIEQIISQYSGNNNLISEEQGLMSQQYLQERSKIFEKTLHTHLSKYGYEDTSIPATCQTEHLKQEIENTPLQVNLDESSKFGIQSTSLLTETSTSSEISYENQQEEQTTTINCNSQKILSLENFNQDAPPQQ